MKAKLVCCSLALALGSCSLLEKELTKPTQENPLSKEQQYLSKGSVSTELDLGPDQKLLLDEFTTLKSQKIALEGQVHELRVANEGLRASLKQAEEERDRTRRAGAVTEAESERVRKVLHEREAKILSLSMERSRLQQENLLLRIGEIERQIEDVRAAQAAEAAAEPGK
jgi:hypothetical protein